MVNVIEIVYESKMASAPTVAYTDTVDNAVACVRHFLGRGQYDSAVVYDADRRPIFRARRWFHAWADPMPAKASSGETVLSDPQALKRISGSGTEENPLRLRMVQCPSVAELTAQGYLVPARVVPQGVNPHEFAARIGKAGKLADAMHRYGITKADALLMNEAMWKLAAMGAGVNPPSSVTQMLAIEQLARLEAAGMRGAA